jgi:hypothetical protein
MNSSNENHYQVSGSFALAPRLAECREGNQAAAFNSQPAPPVRTLDVANVGDAVVGLFGRVRFRIQELRPSQQP